NCRANDCVGDDGSRTDDGPNDGELGRAALHPAPNQQDCRRRYDRRWRGQRVWDRDGGGGWGWGGWAWGGGVCQTVQMDIHEFVLSSLATNKCQSTYERVCCFRFG